ncbi:MULTISPECIES: hypothetical protein [unclassified Paenibacillus]|uniref:hypothetical protein n=1 Tax=unclassified Paenibacillus TaxID=185978 RepID=UPI001C11BAF8|nr:MULTISPECIES: hypothetical protein [unclassified Paenibacillus]MBU5440570.1 hypothetical protein [Paenibacillus sp. MSJ-34]CAH0120036.1 hypothetical protein PAE9249_02549 [Paenibacillus sp. CECT 9249]
MKILKCILIAAVAAGLTACSPAEQNEGPEAGMKPIMVRNGPPSVVRDVYEKGMAPVYD